MFELIWAIILKSTYYICLSNQLYRTSCICYVGFSNHWCFTVIGNNGFTLHVHSSRFIGRGSRFFKNLQKRAGWGRGVVILKNHRPPHVVFTTSELKPASVSFCTFPFWFGRYSWKKNENKIIKTFKFLRPSITPNKANFLDYL